MGEDWGRGTGEEADETICGNSIKSLDPWVKWSSSYKCILPPLGPDQPGPSPRLLRDDSVYVCVDAPAEHRPWGRLGALKGLRGQDVLEASGEAVLGVGRLCNG